MKPAYLYLGVLALALPACKQDKEIKSYPVTKETASAAAPAAGDAHAGPPGMNTSADPHAGVPGMGAGADPHAGVPGMGPSAAAPSVQLTDTPPAHWKKQPPTGMRLATYLVEGEAGAVVEIAASTLRSGPGGPVVIVNLWRGELDQPDIAEAALKESSETIATGLGDATLVDIEGLEAKKDRRMIGAVVVQGDRSWFFKMRGTATLAAAEKANFIQWLKSVNATTTAPAPPAPTAPTAPAATDGSLTWQVPAGWASAAVASGMVYANFTITGTEAKVAVSRLAGNGGGDLANVNRWRGQVMLAPVDAAGLTALVTPITAGPKTLSLIDAAGPQARLVVGWGVHAGESWFFKLTGPDAAIAAEKAKFTAFLESVRFTKPE